MIFSTITKQVDEETGEVFYSWVIYNKTKELALGRASTYKEAEQAILDNKLEKVRHV